MTASGLGLPPPRAGEGARRVFGAGLLAAALALGVALRVSAWIGAETWLDEYHTLLVAGAPTAADVLAFASVEAHPPTYLLSLHGVLALLGRDPLVARGFSVAFGLAALLVVAAAARRRRGTTAAVVATTLLGTSAVAVQYSAEIRPYAAVAFTLLVGALATVSAVERPTAPRLLGQGAALVVALGLNFFALALLPIGPALALLRRRGRLFAQQLLVGAVAFLATAPPLVRVATELPPEANEYLRTFWAGRGPVDALVVVGRDLLPSGRWPPAYGPGARRTPLDAALEAAAVAGLLLAAAGAAGGFLRKNDPGRPDLLDAGCAALLLSAAALAAASFVLGRPVVTPGRYAASFAPAAALLLGAASAWGRAGRTGALLLAGVAAAGAGAKALAPDEGIRVDRSRVVAAVVAKDLRGPLLVISVGLTGTPLKYELRARPDVSFASFPPDVDRHFGWWAPEKALGEPAALARDAALLARKAADAAREGRVVLLTGAEHPVAAPLRSALDPLFLARPLHPLARGAFLLVPRGAPPEGQRR